MMFPDGRIEICEEPSLNMKRFRYESEGRFTPLVGIRSTPTARTFPSIRVLNYTGKARVVVSCVTADEPYRQHPHRLVGENCHDGICYINKFYTDSSEPTILTFPDIRIQSCLKREIPALLEERARLNINPFDLSAYGEDDLKRDTDKVRLCFQVIYNPDPQNRARTEQFPPIVSQPIINNKAESDVKIHEISETFSPASGGKKIIISCSKITRKDIEIRFYEEDAEEKQTLIGLGSFQPSNVYQDVVIVFTTPKYDFKYVDSKPPNIFIELVRPSDNTRSNRLPFHYVPDATNVDVVKWTKQQKIEKSKKLLLSLFQQ